MLPLAFVAQIADEPFAKAIEQMLRNDLDKSQPYDPSSLLRASFLKRLAVSVARLTAPLL